MDNRGVYTKSGFEWKHNSFIGKWECDIGEYYCTIIKRDLKFECSVYYSDFLELIFKGFADNLPQAKGRCRHYYEKHKLSLIRENTNA